MINHTGIHTWKRRNRHRSWNAMHRISVSDTSTLPAGISYFNLFDLKLLHCQKRCITENKASHITELGFD
jgi:hypothetical protein